MRRALHRLRAILFVVALVGILPTGPAQASSTLAVPYTTTGDLSDQRVVANAAGDTTAVWRVALDGATKILAASRPAGGDWGAPTTVASLPTPTEPAGLEPDLEGLVVSPQGVPLVLWQNVELASRVPSDLVVSTPGADGSWKVDRTVASSGFGLSSSLTSTASGELIVVWSTATSRPVEFYAEKVKAGMVMVTQRSASGAWLAPVALGAGNGIDARPTVAVNAAGAAIASWNPVVEVYEPAPVLWAVRTPAGSWAPGPAAAAIRTGGSSVLGPLVDDAGRAHFLPYGAGSYGLAALGHQVAGPGVPTPSRTTDVPSGSRKQTIGGWIGGGYIGGAGATFDAAGRLVVVTARESNDVENGGFGTGGLFSATRSDAGTWSTVRVDPLGETTNAIDVTVSNDRAGAVVATWGVTRDPDGCGTVVYRSVRGADGRWSPRAVVAIADDADLPPYVDLQATQGTCVAVRPVDTGGADPLLWWVDRATLVVTPPTAVGSAAAVVPQLTLETSRWRDVRQAGGIVVRCATPGEGLCSLSRVLTSAKIRVKASSRRPTKATTLRARALGCLALRQTTSVAGPAGFAKLARSPGCSRGWEPPTMSFSLLVTYEAVGHVPSARRITVKIRR